MDEEVGVENNYKLPMGSFDGGQMCKSLCWLLLYNINTIIDPEYHGLYKIILFWTIAPQERGIW